MWFCLSANILEWLILQCLNSDTSSTFERLKEYAGRFKAGSGWQFLTGAVNDIIATQKAFDAYRGGKMNHIPLTFLRSTADGPWLRLEGFTSAAEVVAEYRQHLSQY